MILNFIKKYKNYDSDYKLSFIIASYFVCMMLFTVLKRLLGGDEYTIISIVISFPIVIAFTLLCIKKIVNFRFFSILILISTLLLLTYARGVSFNVILSYLYRVVLCCILFNAIYEISDYKKLYLVLKKSSYIMFFLSIPIIFVDKSVANYSMHFSYLLLIPLCIHLISFFQKDKWWPVILCIAFIEFLIILLFGSRGPLLCLFVFGILYFIFVEKKVVRKIIIISVLLFLLLTFNYCVSFIINVLKNMNLTSRTLYLLENDFFYNSGRDSIIDLVLIKISEKPLLGWGLAGEFSFQNQYVHNFILEFFIDYGIIMGGILILLVIFMICKALLKTKDYDKFLLLVFLVYGFVILFVSESYITHDGFYILIAFVLKKCLYNKTENNLIYSDKLILY